MNSPASTDHDFNARPLPCTPGELPMLTHVAISEQPVIHLLCLALVFILTL